MLLVSGNLEAAELALCAGDSCKAKRLGAAGFSARFER
jgi:hypothetical protein